jgi:DNA phosphorothioation-dependent restriction protein DptG
LTQDATSTEVESVATVLEENMKETIDDWYQRLGAEQLLNGPITTKTARASHLPALFQELIHRLRNPVALGSTTLVSKGAAAHGLLRFQQGYPAAVLIEESRCLQVSIFNTLNANRHRIDFNRLLPDVIVIADEVDGQLAMAMASYTSNGAITSVVPVAPV